MSFETSQITSQVTFSQSFSSGLLELHISRGLFKPLQSKKRPLFKVIATLLGSFSNHDGNESGNVT